MSDKDMINYYIREQKALEYGTDFFEDICRMNIKTIENKILPFPNKSFKIVKFTAFFIFIIF